MKNSLLVDPQRKPIWCLGQVAKAKKTLASLKNGTAEKDAAEKDY